MLTIRMPNFRGEPELRWTIGVVLREREHPFKKSSFTAFRKEILTAALAVTRVHKH